jgi:hypothetical protein
VVQRMNASVSIIGLLNRRPAFFSSTDPCAGMNSRSPGGAVPHGGITAEGGGATPNNHRRDAGATRRNHRRDAGATRKNNRQDAGATRATRNHSGRR